MIIINYAKSADVVEKVVSEIGALGAKAVVVIGDLSKPAEIVSLFEKAVRHYGHVNIVVSDSGSESSGHIYEITPKGFNRVSTELRSTLAARCLLSCKRTNI